jgi:hypothetical protein
VELAFHQPSSFAESAVLFLRSVQRAGFPGCGRFHSSSENRYLVISTWYLAETKKQIPRVWVGVVGFCDKQLALSIQHSATQFSTQRKKTGD